MARIIKDIVIKEHYVLFLFLQSSKKIFFLNYAIFEKYVINL